MRNHLQTDRWCYVNRFGKLQGKRVSKKMEAQFPKELRRIYIAKGAGYLVGHMRREENLTLAQAWERVKIMFNS
jgi:hypothetical protein